MVRELPTTDKLNSNNGPGGGLVGDNTGFSGNPGDLLFSDGEKGPQYEGPDNLRYSKSLDTMLRTGLAIRDPRYKFVNLYRKNEVDLIPNAMDDEEPSRHKALHTSNTSIHFERDGEIVSEKFGGEQGYDVVYSGDNGNGKFYYYLDLTKSDNRPTDNQTGPFEFTFAGGKTVKFNSERIIVTDEFYKSNGDLGFAVIEGENYDKSKSPHEQPLLSKLTRVDGKLVRGTKWDQTKLYDVYKSETPLDVQSAEAAVEEERPERPLLRIVKQAGRAAANGIERVADSDFGRRAAVILLASAVALSATIYGFAKSAEPKKGGLPVGAIVGTAAMGNVIENEELLLNIPVVPDELDDGSGDETETDEALTEEEQQARDEVDDMIAGWREKAAALGIKYSDELGATLLFNMMMRVFETGTPIEEDILRRFSDRFSQGLEIYYGDTDRDANKILNSADDTGVDEPLTVDVSDDDSGGGNEPLDSESAAEATSSSAETDDGSVETADPGIQFDENGLLVMEKSELGQQVINRLFAFSDKYPDGSKGIQHSQELNDMINQLTTAQALWALSRMENPGFGQSGAGYYTASRKSHEKFVEDQLNKRFNGSIHELLMAWGTLDWGGY